MLLNSRSSLQQLVRLQPHTAARTGTFTLTDDRGKTVTDQTHGFKKEFAVLLFGSLDHPDFHMWMEKFAKALYESGAA